MPAAVLLALAASLACGMRKPLPEGADLIPADTTFAVSLDVPSLMNSQLYQMYKSKESAFGLNRINLYRFAEAAGLDPNDIQRVVFLATANDQGLQEMTGLVMGTFEGRKVLDFLEQSGLPSRTVEKTKIFEMVVVNDRCRFCLAVVDASTAVFGDGETLEKIARVKAGSAKGLVAEEGPGRLLRRMGRDPEGWGIIRAGDLRGLFQQVLGQFKVDSGPLAALAPLREVSFSFENEEPIRVLLELNAGSEKDAMRIADMLKGAESVGRLTLREVRPELGGFMSDLVIDADTGIVRAAGSIPPSDVEMAARLLGAALAGFGGGSGGDEPPADEPDAHPEASATRPNESSL